MLLWRVSFCCTALTLTTSTGLLAQQSLCGQVDEGGHLKLKPSQVELLEALCDCTGVLSVELKKLPLIKLPACFNQLLDLRKLDLSRTGLATFPMAICEMYTLEHLSIAHTDIVYLPDEIADLPNLQYLDLRGTGIEDLPHGLEHLHTIDMRLIMLSKLEQDDLRSRFPNTKIFFSSPCHCH